MFIFQSQDGNWRDGQWLQVKGNLLSFFIVAWKYRYGYSGGYPDKIQNRQNAKRKNAKKEQNANLTKCKSDKMQDWHIANVTKWK